VNKTIASAFASALFSFCTLLADDTVLLKWKFESKMSINLHQSGSMETYANNKLLDKRMEQNIVNLTIVSTASNRASLKGVFKTFYSRTTNTGMAKIDQIYDSFFVMLDDGRYIVSDDEKQPSVRSIPSFPDYAVAPGDNWTKDAEFYYHELQPPFFITTPVRYEYISNVILNGANHAVIKTAFTVDEDAGKQLAWTAPEHIGKVNGESRGIIYWDISAGRPSRMSEYYSELLIYNNGDILNMLRAFETVFSYSFPIAVERMRKAAEAVSNIAKKSKGVGAYITDEGMHVELGELLFDYNSPSLSAASASTLSKISEVLKAFTNAEFQIEGHTDNIGSSTYNQALSMKRAEAVGAFLKMKIPDLENRIYLHGAGASRPIADNGTPEGRKKNRRVEILIKQSGE
jgi:outer membrane protein OmpA-like peptidoglycan-associated protein